MVNVHFFISTWWQLVSLSSFFVDVYFRILNFRKLTNRVWVMNMHVRNTTGSEYDSSPVRCQVIWTSAGLSSTASFGKILVSVEATYIYYVLHFRRKRCWCSCLGFICHISQLGYLPTTVLSHISLSTMPIKRPTIWMAITSLHLVNLCDKTRLSLQSQTDHLMTLHLQSGNHPIDIIIASWNQ